jgi:hypothetical protein
MFAPNIAKPQIKAAESSTLVRGRSAAFARPFGVWAREARGDHEQEAEPMLDGEAEAPRLESERDFASFARRAAFRSSAVWATGAHPATETRDRLSRRSA